MSALVVTLSWLVADLRLRARSLDFQARDLSSCHTLLLVRLTEASCLSGTGIHLGLRSVAESI